jgi:6-pyruvoyltetrahydropterin/6-carboxytetrahydropterin synthase
MFEVSVDDSFAAAHNLRNYKGKCENLHGHNYKVRVTLSGRELDETGLLYDFVHLKQVIQSVIRSLDHH